MKFIKQFATDELMNKDALQINHTDGVFLYQGQSIKFIDETHPGPNCIMLGSVNMTPVKLDISSTKKIPDVADILYSTTDGKLTLDAQTNNVDNTPIAICVIPEVKENFENGDDSTGAIRTARFVSLNYMSYKTPRNGSDIPIEIIFGNVTTIIGNIKGRTDNTGYIGGKWNTQQCLSKAINQDKHICFGIKNSADLGCYPAACCCVGYSTPGTKSGDWYLPMPGELYQIYVNKTVIDEKRTLIKGKGFVCEKEDCYWSSREDTSVYEYKVNITRGKVGSGKKYHTYYYTLAFLAVEY